MPKKYLPQFRDCVICGENFHRASVGWAAITCSPECSEIRQKQKLAELIARDPEAFRLRRNKHARNWCKVNPEGYAASRARYYPRKKMLERMRGRETRVFDREKHRAYMRAWRAKRRAAQNADQH